MQARKLLLISCMQVLFLSVKLQTTSEEIITSLNARLLHSTHSSLPANPSIHIALRLSMYHSLHDERRYLRRLKTDFQNKLSSFSGVQLSTDLAALYLLALRASCQDRHSQNRVISYLKSRLRAEKRHATQHDVSYNNYYQYSLGVLALCVNVVRIDSSVLSGLVPHEHHHHWFHALSGLTPHEHHRHWFVGTSAMMVLALKCVSESKVPNTGTWMYSSDTRKKVQSTMNKLIQKIQDRQRESGEIGDIYSTSLAMQALLAGGDEERWLKGKARLLIEAQQGMFRNPMALSQLLPVLYQRTYLDIGQINCINENDGLKWMRSDHRTEHNSNNQKGFVHLTVNDMNGTIICTAKVRLFQKMSLQAVLNEARINDAKFNFETRPTLWGPFLTSVCNLRAQDNSRNYWRLLTGNNTPLKQGIQDYRPHQGEHIVLRLSKF
ncbi:transcobalamin-2 isoform X2 [Rhincodon typus]|nr:transcobalamin-2 isoform X2 [Rhincodon typus]XP_048467273.1 transcobalamin-2 isoform X2 [Rhincodon typus]XP_048467274.1 transcobalamin-2 isoform X2 [Rhincodon typus]XP_048467275.1 transcobalamin-2 isoform X2 [Rhincodon typus]XP_048467276.1 transcobalamin-2 isoform X2 [Rhincodon typus]